MNVSAEFGTTTTSDFFHFCVILNQMSRVWKYASFEGVQIVVSP